jgi:pilus assembly protein CpaE
VTLLKAAFGTVVIDASKGLQSSDFIAFEMSEAILVVVQLELTCLRNTARLLQLYRQEEGLIERVKIVVNRSGFRGSEISPKKAEETLNLPIRWEIPNASREFTTARARGVPLDVAAPNCRPLKALDEMARDLTSGGPAQEKGTSRFGRLAASFF